MDERVPDLMLLDIEMPRMDGYELATAMKADPRLRNVPIIMITSRTGEKHRQRAFDIGVERYLGKPYQEHELLRNVFELLAERQWRPRQWLSRARVALLARPGEACERLRAALREAGGDIVLEADPSAIDPAALRAAAPETVLVALDPAVEDALEKFDDVLADPRDRSDLRRSRSGRAPRRLGCRALGAPSGREAASPRRRAAAGPRTR